MDSPDLNLVKTFVLLYETRSVTGTAELLFITQPSVSYALRRLRRRFDDELFTRSAGGLVPTPLATTLYPPLRQALEVVNEAISSAGRFEPAETERTFRLCATDLGELTLLPKILTALNTRAPRCRVEVSPLHMETAADSLRRGTVDVVICTPRIDAPDLERRTLIRERYVGLCTASHPRIRDAPTLDEYLDERHIVVDSTAGHHAGDDVLVRLGRHRTVAARVPHFTVLPEIIASTPHLALVPYGVVESFTRRADVRQFVLPFEIPTVEVALYTLRRAVPSPGIAWFRDLINEVLHAADGPY